LFMGRVMSDPWIADFNDFIEGPLGRRLAAVAGRFDRARRAFYKSGKQDVNLLRSCGEAALELTSHHPIVTTGAAVPVIDVFSDELPPDFDGLRQQAFDVISLGAIGLATNGGDPEVVQAVLATAMGADDASRTLRDILAPGGGLVPPVDGQISPGRIDQLVIWGTLDELLNSLREAGLGYQQQSDWASRARAYATGIVSVEPVFACPGDVVTIRGSGFGSDQPEFTSVMFPTRGGGCIGAAVIAPLPTVIIVNPGGATRPPGPGGPHVPIPPRPVVEPSGWSDDVITVVVPEGSGPGCVGFRVVDGPPPVSPGSQTDVVTAAGMWQSVLGDAIGPAGVLQGQLVVDLVARLPAGQPLPCPPCLPPPPEQAAPNYFFGGDPQIDAFTVRQAEDLAGQAGAISIVAGDRIVLEWDVRGADRVTIDGGGDIGLPWLDQAGVLPRLPGYQSASTGSLGPFTLPWRGDGDWTGQYTISAASRCGVAQRSVSITVREPAPLFGLADAHTHFMAQYAHAGWGIWGRMLPVDETLTGAAAMAAAIPHCDGPNGHGPGGFGPTFDGVLHDVTGFAAFNGWPTHASLAHQQVYIDWLRRAVDGGLRLAVCHAVNSHTWAATQESLHGQHPIDDVPSGMTNGYPDDDMGQVRLQLLAMGDLVRRVDAISGGAGLGWLQIAATADQARTIIAAGKLAIVPGTEVPTLGGWATPEALDQAAHDAQTTPRALISAMLDDLVQRGVRHMFPIHGINNAFGGTGFFVRSYDAANKDATNEYFQPETADPSLGISYRLDEDEFDPGGVMGAVAAFLGYHETVPQQGWGDVPGGHMNSLGLTSHGFVLLEEMMRRGIVIDVDHMGRKSFDATLTVCQKVGYPVVSGHAQFRELKFGWRPDLPVRATRFGLNLTDQQAEEATFRSGDLNSRLLFGTADGRRLSTETDKSPDDVERIRSVGGYLAPILIQQEPQACRCFSVPAVEASSPGSSRSLAQAVLYGYERMHGRRLGFGSDINGAAPMPGPRFGPNGASFIADGKDLQGRDEERASNAQNARPDRAGETFGQTDGVHYVESVSDSNKSRFPESGGTNPFTPDQRDFWEAICLSDTAVPPESSQSSAAVVNFALGLGAATLADVPVAALAPFSVDGDRQRSAFLARQPAAADGSESVNVQQLAAALAPIWTHWEQAEQSSNAGSTWAVSEFGPAKSGLYDAAGNLHRSTGGDRDWDLNIDGLAHYGLLPDLMQDLRNVGVVDQVMSALYRSANDYIQTWERSEQRSKTASLSQLRAAPGLAVPALTGPDGRVHLLAVTGGDVFTATSTAGQWVGWSLASTGVALPGAEAGETGQPFVAAGAVDAFLYDQGILQMYATDAGGQVWLGAAEPQSPWVQGPAGAVRAGRPLGLVDFGSGVDLVAVDATGAVVTSRQYRPEAAGPYGPWSPWTTLPGASVDAGLCTLTMPDGTAHLLGVATDSRLMWSSRAPGPLAAWTAWTPLSGSVFEPGAAIGAVAGAVEITVVGLSLSGRVLRSRLDPATGVSQPPDDLGLVMDAGIRPHLVVRQDVGGVGVACALVIDPLGSLLARDLDPMASGSWWELRSRLAPNGAARATVGPNGVVLTATDSGGIVWTSTWHGDTDVDEWQRLTI
jgi:Membrane dipeptidase (Peptidase family M19)